MSPISVPISHSKHVKSLILTTHHPPTHIQTVVWNVWLLCYDPISLYCSSTHVIQKRHIQSTFWSLQSDAPSWSCEPKTSVKGPFPCKYSIMSFFNCKWHPLMAFIVSYTFACYSRSNSIIYEHTADIFFLSMSFNCSDIDHLIKLRTQTCTAFLYFQHLLSPSSSGSCVIHSRSSRYLLLIHLEIITPPLHTSFFCRNWHGVVASFLAKFSDVILS